MWTYNGKRVNEGDAWTDDNGTQHPSNWAVWSNEEKKAAGLVWIDNTEPNVDQRFYWVTSNGDGTYTVTAKDIVTLKKDWISNIKVTCSSLLKLSDWEIIAKVERNREISSSTAVFRESVLSTCNNIESQINACSTVEELIPVVENIEWPSSI